MEEKNLKEIKRFLLGKSILTCNIYMDLLTLGQIGGGTKMLPSHWHVAVNKPFSPGPFYFVQW